MRLETFAWLPRWNKEWKVKTRGPGLVSGVPDTSFDCLLMVLKSHRLDLMAILCVKNGGSSEFGFGLLQTLDTKTKQIFPNAKGKQAFDPALWVRSLELTEPRVLWQTTKQFRNQFGTWLVIGITNAYDATQ